MDRKKKLRITQISLFLLGVIVISLTYFQKQRNSEENFIPKEVQKKIEKKLTDKSIEGDIFYDIEYKGIDLSGNRYVIKSKEAISKKSQTEEVFMRDVSAFFYFKDNTILKIQSNSGIYNNRTLDMKFIDDVKGYYKESTLFAEKAEYLNSKNTLTISKKVVVNDVRGKIIADQLFFDLKKETLDIKSFKDNKINANLNYNEEKF